MQNVYQQNPNQVVEMSENLNIGHYYDDHDDMETIIFNSMHCNRTSIEI